MSLGDKDIKVGDLVLLKPEMMLVPPRGPAIVLKVDHGGVLGLCEVMYLHNNYVINAHVDMDIERVVTLEGSGLA
mgnify:CR=1 FL=1